MSQNKIDVLLKVNAQTRDLIRVQNEAQKVRRRFVEMARMGVAFSGAQMGLQGILNTLRSSVGEGIRFNRMIQDTTDSIRAMVLASDSLGNMNEALTRASGVMTVLRRRANESGEALSTVVEIFQESAAIARQSGASFEDWANIAVEATRAGNNLGLSAARIRTQLAQIASGNVRDQNILARAIGLDSESVKSAIEAGTLVDLLRQKLAPYQTRVEGLSAAQARLGNTISETWGRIALPLFEQLEREANNFTSAIERGGGATRSFGEIMADAVRVTSAALRLFIDLVPALVAIGSGYAVVKTSAMAAAIATSLFAASQTRALTAGTAVQLNSVGAAIARITFAATTGTTVFGRMGAVVRALGASLRLLFLANPFTAILTAITAILGALYFWNLRQREINRRLSEARQETERIRLAGRDRIAGLTSEEARQTAVRDIAAEILALEEKITKEKNDRVRGELANQQRLLEAQRRAAESAAPQQLRDNARAAEEARRRAADIAALPDRIAESERRAEERRIAAMSADERVKALEARRDDLAKASLGDARVIARELQELDDVVFGPARESFADQTRALEDLLRRGNSISGAQAAAIGLDRPLRGRSQEDAAFARSRLAEINTIPTEAQLKAMIATTEAQRAELSARLEAANQLADTEAELADARRERDEAAARAAADLRNLDIEGIRIAEQEQRAAYARTGNDTRAHYATLANLAEERWEREIEAARDAAETEADLQRVTNLERQKALELSDLALRRDRDLEQQYRRNFDMQIENISDLIRETDKLLLNSTQVAERTRLERTRAELIERANKAFAEYQSRVKGLNLPDTDRVRAPEFGDTPGGRVSGLQQVADRMGDTMANLDTAIVSVAESMRDGIGGAIEGLINRTTSWREALLNIGQAFVSSMVRAFADMVAQYAVSRAAMFAIERTQAARSLALSVANAAKSLVARIPAAIAASISSFGMAAAIGAAAVAGVLLTKGFAEGGHTGSGGVNQPAGVVHAGEWVAPQWMVNSPEYAGTIAALEAARRGRATVGYSLPRAGYAAGGVVAEREAGNGTGGAGEGTAVSVAVLNTRDDMRKFMEGEGRKFVVDIIKGASWELGRG